MYPSQTKSENTTGSISQKVDREECQMEYTEGIAELYNTIIRLTIHYAIRTLVHAFICSRIDFSSSLLYGTSVYLLDRLQSVLNSSARLIRKIRKYDPISTAVRRDLHWLPIQARIQFKLNVITRNCLVGQAPSYLTELCHFINEIPARRNLRSATQVQLLVPCFRKERSGRRGFSISSPQLWNRLPADIRLLYKEPQLFRKRLKTHYMQQSILHHWWSMSPVRHLLLLLCKYSAGMHRRRDIYFDNVQWNIRKACGEWRISRIWNSAATFR